MARASCCAMAEDSNRPTWRPFDHLSGCWSLPRHNKGLEFNDRRIAFPLFADQLLVLQATPHLLLRCPPTTFRTVKAKGYGPVFGRFHQHVIDFSF
jgi:hypothetical protein